MSLGQPVMLGGARRFSGRRQPSCDDTSRMNREVHVRICERLRVKFPGPTRQDRRIDDVKDVSGVLPIASVLQCVGDPRAVPADDFWLGRRRWSGTQNSRVLDCAHLFAGSHPKLARFGIGVALNRAGLASGNFCCDNSAVNAATLCSASASVAAVPRTCAMSSFKAVLSISIPLPSRGADNCIALKK